jgi:hypothetical protein
MCTKGWLSLLAFAATLSSPVALRAQTVTSGALSGEVVDQQQAVIPGANVVAVHTPTGTTYESVTASDGRCQILNVRVGGPYTVTVSVRVASSRTRSTALSSPRTTITSATIRSLKPVRDTTC